MPAWAFNDKQLTKGVIKKISGPTGGCDDNEVCPKDRDPVCGSDDVSHWNECQLRSKACDFPERNITVKHPGNCTTGASYAAASLELKMDCALAFVKHAHVQSGP